MTITRESILVLWLLRWKLKPAVNICGFLVSRMLGCWSRTDVLDC